MGQQDTKKRFWRILAPLLLYWVVRWVAELIGETILFAAHWPELIDVTKLSTITEAEMSDYMMDMMVKFMKVVFQHMTELTVFMALVAIPLALFYFIRDRKKSKVEGITKDIPSVGREPLWKYAMLIILGAALCLGLNNLINMCDIAFFHGSTSQSLDSMYESGLWIQVLGLGIVVPISEELMYRGVLFWRYRELGTFSRAAIYSGILFALTHGTALQILYALILGVVLAYSYEKYNSILAPILLHAAANLTSIIGTQVDFFTWMLTKPIRAGVITILCAFLGSAVVVFMQGLENKRPEEKKVEKSDN